MGYLHQWDYLLVFGTFFSLLDAFNIGANDVANSFATSISSKSLTLRQAVLMASICEFSGAMLAGSHVSSTIKNGIVASTIFQQSPGVQLLAFVCAISASATWLMIATRNSWPVSTTYSIISSLAGVGIATGGFGAVSWGWNGGKGIATIFAGFIIAPGLAAVFAATVFLLTKFGVLLRKNSVRAGLIASPIYFFGLTAILTLSIIYKGAPELNLDELPESTLAAVIPGTAAVVAVLSAIFWLPYIYCRVVRDDYTLRWYHFFLGPILWSRQPPADAGQPGAHSAVPDYGIRTNNELDHIPMQPSNDGEFEKGTKHNLSSQTLNGESSLAKEVEGTSSVPYQSGSLLKPGNIWIFLRYRVWDRLTYGLRVDVTAMQRGNGQDEEADRLARMHERAVQFDNKTEYMYSFLQVMTACTASFAHGSNDLANAVGPWATIYYVWSTGELAGKKTPTPLWIIAVGGIMLCIGLATFGYNILSVLGNKMTLMSPSRGFSMELGSAITVLLASQYGIPVSTTMCITGATLGVALCNGDIHAYNWRGLAWIVTGWVITLPVAAISGGCLMAILLNAPSF